MNEFDLGFLVGMGALMLFAVLMVIMFSICEWFSSVSDARNCIKELEEKIDFDKLIADYKKSDEE